MDAPISSPSRFLDYLNQIASSTPTDTGCVVETWAALLATMRERYDGNEQRVLPRKSVVTLLEVRNGERTERLVERTVAGVVSEQHGSARDVRLRGAHPARDPLQRLPAARHDDEELDVRNDAGLSTASDGSERLSTSKLRKRDCLRATSRTWSKRRRAATARCTPSSTTTSCCEFDGARGERTS